MQQFWWSRGLGERGRTAISTSRDSCRAHTQFSQHPPLKRFLGGRRVTVQVRPEALGIGLSQL